MRTPRWAALLVALLIPLALVACGGDDNNDNGGSSTPAAQAPSGGIQKNSKNASVKLTIGSKNFTEQKVLGEIYAQALGAAGYSVSTQLNLGDEKTALKALKQGEISAYPEYTGTILTSFFGKKAEDLPKDNQKAYDQAKFSLASEGITALPPTPFVSSNEVAVTKETADKYSLKKISDLSKVASKLTLYGSPECRQRLDCLLGLQQVYGLKFKKFVPVDIALRHQVLTSGQADVSIVFTTDPQIKREGFVLLEDDKGMFPPYNSTLLLKKETADKAGPDLETVVGQVNKGLTDEVMQELNARVDLDKKTPDVVAGEYLKESGLVN
jgi:osmoprotectant transport system substrate-binding protein